MSAYVCVRLWSTHLVVFMYIYANVCICVVFCVKKVSMCAYDMLTFKLKFFSMSNRKLKRCTFFRISAEWLSLYACVCNVLCFCCSVISFILFYSIYSTLYEFMSYAGFYYYFHYFLLVKIPSCLWYVT